MSRPDRSRSRRSGSGEPLHRNHRQDHRRAGGRPRPLGAAMGDGGDQGAARHAEQCVDAARLFRNQCADPVGRRHRTRLLRPELAHLSPGARARRPCPQGRARNHRRLCRSLRSPDDERQRAAETGEEPGTIPFLKRFTVFNTDQCDGLPEDVAASASRRHRIRSSRRPKP